MKDFFEGAKFGDKYVGADGYVLIYHCSKPSVPKGSIYHYLIKEEETFIFRGRECRSAQYDPYVSRGDCAVHASVKDSPIEKIRLENIILRKCGVQQPSQTEVGLFDNAKFGDKFITRSGKIALFNRHKEGQIASLFVEGYSRPYNYHYDGCSYDNESLDIVSRIPTNI